MVSITGIGGVFFKSRNDRAALAAWYQRLFLQLHRAEVALDLLQRDPARGYVGSGTGKGRRPGPDLRGRTYGAVYGRPQGDRPEVSGQSNEVLSLQGPAHAPFSLFGLLVCAE